MPPMSTTPMLTAGPERSGATSLAPPAWIAVVLMTLVLPCGGAVAQQTTPGHQAAPPAAAAGGTASSPQTPPDPATGFFGTVFQGGTQVIQQTGQQLMQQGDQFVQQGVATVGAGFGQVVGTGDAAEAARTAATNFTKLPVSSITAGHERCAIAPNGAPDCLVAARTLCQAKGFGGGTSVDFITVENCPPQYRTARRDEVPAGVCTMEHYVTHALCQ